MKPSAKSSALTPGLFASDEDPLFSGSKPQAVVVGSRLYNRRSKIAKIASFQVVDNRMHQHCSWLITIKLCSTSKP